MDEIIEEAFKAVAFKPPRTVAEMACWHILAKEQYKSSWDVFHKLGFDTKQISKFMNRWNEGLANYQRREWVKYDAQYNTEIRYIISLC